MKLFFEYGRHAATVPAVPAATLKRAGKVELMLLVALGGDGALLNDYESAADRVAASLGVTRAALDAAVGFWIGAGILTKDGDAEAPEVAEKPAEPAVTVPPRTVVTELPHYTVDEAQAVMSRRPGAAELVDDAQKTLGRVFTSHSEISQLLGIVEGLGLSDEYILLLLAHCRNMGKTSMRYAEKLAVSLYDADITSPEALSEHLHGLEMAASTEGKLRTLLGVNRSFTAKEKGFIAEWVGKFAFEDEMIAKAFEFAADATTNPTVNYMHSILSRWHEGGIKTPADADRDREQHRGTVQRGKGKSVPAADPMQATSFNANEFFEAALRRGYTED